MIRSWFTQPPGKFASYYQYDTTTRELTRVRLELGRTSVGRSNNTSAFYNADRAVGFSKTKLSFDSSDPGEHWSVHDGRICYDDTPLPGPPPKPGDRVYDTTNPDSFVHPGNAVTDNPTLPAGIKPEHLALLANDAQITENTIILTAGNVNADVLIAKIKSEVCRIVGVQDFATITDQAILTKLTGQAKQISDIVAHDDQSSLNDALKAARDAYALVSKQISDDTIVPNGDFNKAFAELDSALTAAQSASASGDVTAALKQITIAQQAVDTAVEIDAATAKAAKSQLDTATKSLSDAQQHATEWMDTDTRYEPLTKAGSVKDYMDSMAGDEGI